MWVYYTIIVGIALYGAGFIWTDPNFWENLSAVAIGYGSIVFVLVILFAGAWVFDRREKAKRARQIAAVRREMIERMPWKRQY